MPPSPKPWTLAALGAAAAIIGVSIIYLRKRRAQAGNKPLKEIKRSDYTEPEWLVPKQSLVIQLDEPAASAARGKALTVIKATLELRLAAGSTPVDLVLNMEDCLELVSVLVDGKPLTSGKGFALSGYDETLTIRASALRKSCTLTTTVVTDPSQNLELQGLYKSSGVFCTQMEAEGFRRMTPSLDRPDVLSIYQVRLEADAQACPVLLSNGDRVDGGELDGGKRHFAAFHDPHPKPCYLFAAVAGDLGSISGKFTTASGKPVDIRIFTEHASVPQLPFAMKCIQKAMRWDEVQFGREYDLTTFNIVAVADFNMGAMENKGLNVFNSKCVLATPESATDAAMRRVEGIIAHEYFHNWTGNRVTCRDWFQLTLKEGLTVYRDIRFTSDQSDVTVKRIEDVKTMRQMQFPEDAGPMAHPIRPEAYIKMDNFYTRTVYRKGSEIIRMYETLLGRQGFRKGMDLYFERHDGAAVTCDDFRKAMADANESAEIRSEAFGRWYSQAGTPSLRVVSAMLAPGGKTYELTLEQATGPTPGQATKQPLLMPVAVGLISSTGRALSLRIAGQTADKFHETIVLRFASERQTFSLEVNGTGSRIESALGIGRGSASQPQPTLSILRGWSAPVKLVYDAQTAEGEGLRPHLRPPRIGCPHLSSPFPQPCLTRTRSRPLTPAHTRSPRHSRLLAPARTLPLPRARGADLAVLMAHDTDGFNRFEAAARFATRCLVSAAEALRSGKPPSQVEFDGRFVAAWGQIFDDVDGLKPLAADAPFHLLSQMLKLPAEVEVLNELEVYDAHAVATARRLLAKALAESRKDALLPLYAKIRVPPSTPHALTKNQEGRRALTATLLSYVAALETEAGYAAIAAHFNEASNMTDASAALLVLASCYCPQRQVALGFYESKWKSHREAIDTWFIAQATSGLPGAAERLKGLMAHECFSLSNPNKVRAVIGMLGLSAPSVLFSVDVLRLVGDVILQVDALNGNLAASLCKMLQMWRKLPEPLRAEARGVLERVQARKGCSKNAGEVAATALR